MTPNYPEDLPFEQMYLSQLDQQFSKVDPCHERCPPAYLKSPERRHDFVWEIVAWYLQHGASTQDQKC